MENFALSNDKLQILNQYKVICFLLLKYLVCFLGNFKRK